MHNLNDWLTFLVLVVVIFGLMYCLGTVFDEIDMLRSQQGDDDDHIDASF